MPAKTPRQQRFFGAEYARAKAGKKTKTGMGVRSIKKMATKPAGGYKKKKRKVKK